MTEKPDATVARRLYDVLERGAIDELSELLAPNVQWHVPGASLRSGTYVGRDETLALFGTRRSNVIFRLLDILTSDNFVMALVQHRADNDEDGSDVPHIIHMMRTQAGRISESWHFEEHLGARGQA